MKIKVRVDEAGSAYVGVIDPSSGDHKKSVAVGKGQEVELGLPDVTTAERVEIGNVLASEGDPAAADGQEELLAGLDIGRVVIYRSRTGKYDCPAVVTATVATLNPEGVEAGHVPPLTLASNVHLTVFTPGKPGKRESATDFESEPEHGRSENLAGTYQEWDIPRALPGGDIPPGTWRWAERI